MGGLAPPSYYKKYVSAVEAALCEVNARTGNDNIKFLMNTYKRKVSFEDGLADMLSSSSFTNVATESSEMAEMTDEQLELEIRTCGSTLETSTSYVQNMVLQLKSDLEKEQARRLQVKQQASENMSKETATISKVIPILEKMLESGKKLLEIATLFSEAQQF